MIFVNYSWIVKVLFIKISSQNAWLVHAEVSELGTSNSRNLGKCNLLSRQNGMNHENFRPWKFGAIYMLATYIDKIDVAALEEIRLLGEGIMSLMLCQ